MHECHTDCPAQDGTHPNFRVALIRDQNSSRTQAFRQICPTLKAIVPCNYVLGVGKSRMATAEKPVDVIVQFNTSAENSDLSESGVGTKAYLPLVNAKLVTVQGADLDSLAKNPSVAYVSPDRKVRTSTNKAVTAVNADLATAAGWDGTGITVAVIDSGVSNTSDDTVIYSQSFVPGDTSTNDAYGHGTYVAALVAGNGYASLHMGPYADFYRERYVKCRC